MARYLASGFAGASVSLVILDLNMPGMGGEETLQHLKSLRRAVPVILSSGYNEEEATRKFTARWSFYPIRSKSA